MTPNSAEAPLETPLSALHIRRGARIGAFAGYALPLRYEAGIIAEHTAVRGRAGLFDVSHMGQIAVEGEDSARLIARLSPVGAAAMAAGSCKYGLLLNERAGILDDFIVSRLGENRYLVVVNAANADVGLALFESEAETLAASVKRIPRAMLAVQGPESRSLLSSRIPQAADLSFMKAIELPNGQFLSATGYTGEDGFEIALAADDADRFAEEILAGDALQLAGLGARDSLRLEAGLCLHGQDLSEETTPYEAGLGWSISRRALGEGGFRGDVALRKAAASQPARRLVGLLPQGRAPVRSGVQLYSRHGNATGTVTSGGFSPTLSRPIAMGYIAAEFSVEGTRIEAEVRGRRVPCEVTALPFVPHRYWRPARK